ncbi:MAG: FtsX-like permease family protein [Bifidobacteriaceae bacterium]|jgi:putative ABC transport system permease protein|nr:FtsX-like permease family protein [Bifidobacteriaceae bacterium]
MRRTLMLAWANIRGAKGAAAGLLGVAALAALVLNLGLMMLLDYGKAFDRQADRANAPHFAVSESRHLWTEEQATWLADHPDVTQVEILEALTSEATIPYNGAEVPATLIIMSVDTPHSLDRLIPMDGAQPLGDGDIYLPYMDKVGGGLAIGDAFTMTFGTQKLTYRIAGFTNEAYFSSPADNIQLAYLNQATFTALEAALPATQVTLALASLTDRDLGDQFTQDFSKLFVYDNPAVAEAQAAGEPSFISTYRYSTARYGRTFMVDILSAIMVVFAGLILVVALIVIRFRVRNSIEEQMANLGALKAVGYTSGQIAWGIVAQFAGLTLVGVGAGIGLTYAALPAVSKALEGQSSMIWTAGFDITTSAVTLAAVVGTVLLVTLAAAARLRRLTPLTALRAGLAVHSFRRNNLPLDRSHGSPTWLLGAKTALQAKGQMIMVALIVAVVSFMPSFALSCYYDTAVNNEEFVRTIAGEMPDALVQVKPAQGEAVLADVQTRPGVRKAFGYSRSMAMLIDGNPVWAFATEDQEQLEGRLLYEGRYARHENELVMTPVLASTLDKTIGDTVTLSLGGEGADYLVTGLIQSMNEYGMLVGLNTDGIKRVLPSYQFDEVFVYLDDIDQAEPFLDAVAADLGEAVVATLPMWTMAQAQLRAYGDLFGVVATAILVIAIVVVVLVLYLVLGATILRRRRSFGIQKALGYTSGQLMRQIAFTYMPVIAAAVLAGALAGYLAFGSMMGGIFRWLGIVSVHMQPWAAGSAVLALVLVPFAFAVAMLVARRIRRVSAYALATE